MVNAFATLLFTNSYLPGALILGKSLKQLNTFDNETKLIVLLAIQLTHFELKRLKEVYDEIHNVSLIHARNSNELQLLGRPELSPTFSKIHLFKFTQFDKILFLDADILPVKPLEELFTIYSDLSPNQIVASPDSGWPDIFNSGVFLIKPSVETYLKLLDKIQLTSNPSFDGADQGLLNQFFHLDTDVIYEQYSWVKLPFLFNVTPSSQYQYQPAFNFFDVMVKLIHFIGPNKPWTDFSDKGGLRKRWWDKYHEFFGDSDDIQKTLYGIYPVYYKPVYSKEENEEPYKETYRETYKESHQELAIEHNSYNEVLLNPESFKYFETVQTNANQWDPIHEKPPKNGLPEAASFPQLHNYSGGWSDNQSQGDDYCEPEAPPPIFPWEAHVDRPKPERKFATKYSYEFFAPCDTLPIVKKIKDRQEQELTAQETAQKRAENLAEKNEEDQKRLFDQKKRLKAIKSCYNDGTKLETIDVKPTELQPEPFHLEEPEHIGETEESELIQSMEEVTLNERIDELQKKLAF